MVNVYFENSVIPTVLHCTLTLCVLCVVTLLGNSEGCQLFPCCEQYEGLY